MARHMSRIVHLVNPVIESLVQGEEFILTMSEERWVLLQTDPNSRAVVVVVVVVVAGADGEDGGAVGEASGHDML
jgi:hypothetical protein